MSADTYRTTQGYEGTGCRHHHRKVKGAVDCAHRATRKGGPSVRPYYAVRESDGAEVCIPGGTPVGNLPHVRNELGFWVLMTGGA